MTPPPRSIAVVGGGWAGLAAAVRATQAGHRVTLYEMAPRLGGRARGVDLDGLALDNGQHILIGAYTHTLALMRDVGSDPEHLLLRRPLALVDPAGAGLRLPPGPALPAFARAVLRHPGWRWTERAALLRTAAGWWLRGFRAGDGDTVARLTAHLPAAVRRDLVDPLCVAALNTPSTQASARVFLRVLRDALFAGPGAADLLLPRASLDALLPAPAATWLQTHGAVLHTARRVHALTPDGPAWRVDGERHDAVMLACTSVEAARLAGDAAPAWAARAAAFRHEPIVTVYVDAPALTLAHPMVALADGPAAPAQFVFDLGQLGTAPGLLAAVVSGAGPWVERGLDATAQAVLQQLRTALPDPGRLTLRRTLAERRATFACVPGLQRPPVRIAPGLVAAGDYVEGPYPSTLEGAVRAGEAALRALTTPPSRPG